MALIILCAIDRSVYPGTVKGERMRARRHLTMLRVAYALMTLDEVRRTPTALADALGVGGHTVRAVLTDFLAAGVVCRQRVVRGVSRADVFALAPGVVLPPLPADVVTAPGRRRHKGPQVALSGVVAGRPYRSGYRWFGVAA